MIYSYEEVKNTYKSTYQIRKALANGKIFKIEKGIYSDEEIANPLEIIVKKYPNAIFTMDSAFYFHGLTDVIPKKTYLAVKRDSIRINNSKISQMFVLEKLFEIGKTEITFEGVRIPIYDKERMLIELIRNKKRMAFDYYKEIINSYRRKSNQLDIRNIEDYIKEFGVEDYIFKTIQEEVF